VISPAPALKLPAHAADHRNMEWLSVIYVRLRDQSGQTLAEYGLVVVSIAIVVVAAAALLGVNITGLFTKSSNGL
jgi:Flp pilus assembly pilin Flp